MQNEIILVRSVECSHCENGLYPCDSEEDYEKDENGNIIDFGCNGGEHDIVLRAIKMENSLELSIEVPRTYENTVEIKDLTILRNLRNMIDELLEEPKNENSNS